MAVPHLFLGLLLLCTPLVFAESVAFVPPTAIHTAFTNEPSEVTVSWHTSGAQALLPMSVYTTQLTQCWSVSWLKIVDTTQSVVWYGTQPLNYTNVLKASGASSTYLPSAGWWNTHNVTLVTPLSWFLVTFIRKVEVRKTDWWNREDHTERERLRVNIVGNRLGGGMIRHGCWCFVPIQGYDHHVLLTNLSPSTKYAPPLLGQVAYCNIIGAARANIMAFICTLWVDLLSEQLCRYYYVVGSDQGLSTEFFFTTAPVVGKTANMMEISSYLVEFLVFSASVLRGSNEYLHSGSTEPFSILVYGDMGVDNSLPTIEQINKKVNKGDVNWIYHVGDIRWPMMV